MIVSQKQKIAQQILAHHDSIHIEKITLMYTERPISRKSEKPTIIVSVSKKTTPKAVDRNYNKRVLRAILRESLGKEQLRAYDWMWICKAPTVNTLLQEQLRIQVKLLNTP